MHILNIQSGHVAGKTFKVNIEVRLCLEGKSLIYGGPIMEPDGPFIPQLAHTDHELEDNKLYDNSRLIDLT